jgi:hypothetical protein
MVMGFMRQCVRSNVSDRQDAIAEDRSAERAESLGVHKHRHPVTPGSTLSNTDTSPWTPVTAPGNPRPLTSLYLHLQISWVITLYASGLCL